MKVYYGRKARISGRLLSARLRGVDGPSINFGYQRAGQINPAPAVRLASNKRRALYVLREAGVPTPKLYSLNHDVEFPCVARPDKHRAGQDFYLCNNVVEVMTAKFLGCTHFMEFIEGGREFRVHVAFGKSIKLAEKIGGDPIIKNFSYGSRFMYPDFNHKKTLRNVAKQAVAVLGLDFGAVDVIYKDGNYYVLEVNCAPSLSSDSDILERYVRAFTAYA
jgi:glutathione synthase/RimK-type ligase-like ATP-grasp enzyme